MDTRDVTFPAADGRPMRAAMAIPADGAAHAGVLVIHEIFGLNDDFRGITGRVADLVTRRSRPTSSTRRAQLHEPQ